MRKKGEWRSDVIGIGKQDSRVLLRRVFLLVYLPSSLEWWDCEGVSGESERENEREVHPLTLS